MMHDSVINYFHLGIYKAADLPLFVSAGWITQEEADTLVGIEAD
jgi:uncharacterized XkdX family phage protein